MLTESEALVRHAPPLSHDPNCRLCGDRLHRTVVDLGSVPLATAISQPGEPAPCHPLHVRVCDSCLLVQTQALVGPEGDPRGDSGPAVNSCLEQARRFTAAMQHRLGLGAGSLVIAIGSGDGVALRPFQELGVSVLGIEPDGDVAAAAAASGVPTETGFFKASTAMEIAVRFGRADLVLVSDVLPVVADLFDFAAGFAGILRPKGIVVFQFPHLLPIMQRAQFDAFRHDRYNYLSLAVVEHVLRSVGLRVFDAERLPDEGGALRVYACHPRGPYAARPALKTVRQEETWAGLDRADGYDGFGARVEAEREDIRDFLKIRHAAGRTVAAWGVAARGVMMLNTCGVTTVQVAWVADPDVALHGLRLPGCDIPIVSPDMLLTERPDDLLILPWPRAAEIAAGLLPIRQKGTQFWTFSPGIKRV